MPVPAPDIAALAAFSGRDADAFGPFANAALEQAALLFSVATHRTTLPDDPDQAKLATYAILEMADRIYLEQPYAATAATPFQSETIGSYSYAKGSQAAKAASGQKLGLLWWDLALDELALADASMVASGSIFAFEGAVVDDGEGNRAITSPAEDEAAAGGVGFTRSA